ncbi:hypothetical protein APTSU1_000463200 [Apodemus speciosus]|uniref:Uncharacterized protein n=1 Tax=Apodemus speciosus TaxID=105296 RepID=A0ABQ0ER66_APOSI
MAAGAAGPGSTRRIRLSQPFGYFVLYRAALSLVYHPVSGGTQVLQQLQEEGLGRMKTEVSTRPASNQWID